MGILITQRINQCVEIHTAHSGNPDYQILQLTNNFALLLIFSPKIYFFKLKFKTIPPNFSADDRLMALHLGLRRQGVLAEAKKDLELD